jgi:hypothetical protein
VPWNFLFGGGSPRYGCFCARFFFWGPSTCCGVSEVVRSVGWGNSLFRYAHTRWLPEQIIISFGVPFMGPSHRRALFKDTHPPGFGWYYCTCGLLIRDAARPCGNRQAAGTGSGIFRRLVFGLTIFSLFSLGVGCRCGTSSPGSSCLHPAN